MQSNRLKAAICNRFGTEESLEPGQVSNGRSMPLVNDFYDQSLWGPSWSDQSVLSLPLDHKFNNCLTKGDMHAFEFISATHSVGLVSS